MATGPWSSIVPFGALEIASAGTTKLLSANCGPLGGQVGGSQASPALPGQALRQFRLTNPQGSGGATVYLLPRGCTASDNPGEIIDAILPGESKTFPQGWAVASGFLPENFCLDISEGSDVTVYGCGFLG
jgi:hypothetical protein